MYNLDPKAPIIKKKSSEISYAYTFTNIIANASIDIYGVGPDRTAPAGAARPGLTLFKLKASKNFGCDWRPCSITVTIWDPINTQLCPPIANLKACRFRAIGYLILA